MKLGKDEIELILQETHSCEELFKDAKHAFDVLMCINNMDIISTMMLPKEIADLLAKVTDYYVLLAVHVFSDEFMFGAQEKMIDGAEIHIIIANELILNKLKGDKAKTILEIIERRLRAGEQVNDETATTLFAFERSLNRLIMRHRLLTTESKTNT